MESSSEHDYALLSASIPLAQVVRDEALARRLSALHVRDTTDLWILIALDQVSSESEALALLHSLANHLATNLSPFVPRYSIDHSVSVESTVDPPLHPCRTTFSVVIGLPVGRICSRATIPFIPDERFESREEIEYLAARLAQSPGADKRYETSSPRRHQQRLDMPIRLPLLAEMLDALDRKANSRLADYERREDVGRRRLLLSLREAIVRRRGLVSGEVETLESVAQDVGLTREWVRQLESKALQALFAHKGLGETVSRRMGLFQTRLLRWVSKLGNAVSGQEVLGEFGKYLDFHGYQPSLAMAFLCELAGLVVRAPRREGDVWFASLTEADYERFERVYQMLDHAHGEEERTSATQTFTDFEEVRLVANAAGIESIETVRAQAKRVIGPAKVMRADKFISSLMRYDLLSKAIIDCLKPDAEEKLHSYNPVPGLLAKLTRVSVVPAGEYERIIFGQWITSDLTKRVQAVVRAIIYAGTNQGAIGPKIKPTECLKYGAHSESIVRDLASQSAFSMSEPALEQLCRRNADVFVRTGPRSWGVVGAGASPNPDRVARPGTQHGTIINCVTETLQGVPAGLTLGEVVRQVRREVPTAAETTVKLYLRA